MNNRRIRRKSLKIKPAPLPQLQQFSIEQFAKSNLFQFSNDNFQDQQDFQIDINPNPEPISPIKALKDKLNTPIFTTRDQYSPKKSVDFDKIKSKSTQLTKPNYIRLEELAKSPHQMPRVRSNSFDSKISNTVCIIQKQKALNLSNYIVFGSVQNLKAEKKSQLQVKSKGPYLKKRIVHNMRQLFKKNQQRVQNQYLLHNKINQSKARTESFKIVFDGRLLTKSRNENNSLNKNLSIANSNQQAY